MLQVYASDSAKNKKLGCPEEGGGGLSWRDRIVTEGSKSEKLNIRTSRKMFDIYYVHINNNFNHV